MSFEDAGGKNVNPNFNSGYLGYKLNCTFCIAVFEARLRGYNLEAKPVDKNPNGRQKMLMRYPYFAFISSDNNKITGPKEFYPKNKKACISFLKKEVKPNERYIFYFYPFDSNYPFAHVTEVFKINNKLYFYDPQSGEISNDIILENTKDNINKKSLKHYIFRVDNLEINPSVLKEISQPPASGI